jgi:TonB family protein
VDSDIKFLWERIVEKHSETNLLDEAILEEVAEHNGSPESRKIRRNKVSFEEIEAEIQSLKIQSFPKQFRKPVLQNIDRKFLVSLILSLAIHIALIFWLPRIVPDELEQTLIKRMHQRFVTAILKEKQLLGSSGKAFTGSAIGVVNKQKAQSVSRIIDDILSGIIAQDDLLPFLADDLKKSGKTSPMQKAREKLAPSASARSDARKQADARLQQSRAQNAENVQNIGLLGVVTTGGNMENSDYVEDIIENANKSSENLEGILNQVNALKVPRYQRSTAYLDVNDVSVGLKTGRITGKDDKDFYADVAPLAKIEEVDVARNVEIDVAGSPLAGLNRKKAANGVTRTQKHIAEVVTSHSRVIQDCYKQVLKHQPGLKGRLLVRIEIDTEGKVVHAELVDSSINNPKIEQCVLNRIRRWNNFGACSPSLGIMSFRIPYKFGE